MRPLLEAELAAHAHALRALARLLVGDANADDLVQDTALKALQSPPLRHVGLRGWLSQVLRHLASNHRRNAARRQRREQQGEPPREAESAARVAEHHEAVQRVTAVLLGLPEPYHGTLLLRFFEDLTPTQIAAATGVPLATVKSRLQRGLSLLRERLDAGANGSDWRSALTAAFGLPPVAAIGGAVMVTTGVLMMGSGVKLVVAAVAATAAIAAFLCMRTEPQTVPTPPALTAAPAPVSATSPLAASPTDPPAAAVERREVPLSAPTPPPPGPLATLRGRCVDEHGQPIAGVAVRLTSNSRGSEEMDAWTKDHEMPKDLAESLNTAVDGAFAFHFWPAPPQQFWLWLQADGRATMQGHLPMLVEGSTKDLDDVVMPRGVLLRGRVVDRDGAPMANATVRFATDLRGEGEVVPRDDAHAQTQADGTFVSHWALLPADYGIGVRPGSKPKPDRIHLDGSRGVVDVEIVVDRPSTEELPPIRGVVVDEQGQPVRGASVGIDGYSRLPSFDQDAATSTAADGRFVLKQQNGSPPQVSLLVHKEGFEPLAPPDKFAWGNDDVRLVLRRGLAVEVTVLADADGTPVEDFQVRVFPDPDATDRFGGDQYDVRARGHHPLGKVSIEGIARGNWCVLVEPKGDTSSMNRMMPVRVADPGPSRVVVRLPRRVQRSLHVQFADGSPVVGTRMELADMRGQTPRADTVTRTLTSPSWAQGPGLRLHEAVTDAHGDAVLQGPAGTPLALFVRGPGHVPMVQDGIRLDDTTPLQITVGSGAALVGKVAPLSALVEMRRLADLPETGEIQGTKHGLLPAIRLVRFADPTWQYFPKTGGSTIAEDGTFTIADVPEGQWNVTVTWFEPTNVMASRGPYIGHSATLTSVSLRNGATAEIALDLSPLLPGEVDGLVLLNGKPAATRQVQLVAIVGKSPSGSDDEYSRNVTTEADGRFHLRTRGGDYRLRLWTDRFILDPPERAFVVVGQTTAQTFHLRSGTVRLKLLDAQGRPAPGVRIDALAKASEGQPYWTWLSRTDADGVTTFDAGPTPMTLALLPKSLQDPKAQQDLMAKGGADPFETLRLPLGEVTPKPGETSEVTLHLPADYDR